MANKLRPDITATTTLPAQKRLDTLLDVATTDPTAVHKVPLLELYSLIKEIGLGECEELIPYTSPEQVQGFFDLEVWDGDRLSLQAAIPWLEALLRCGYDDFGTYFQQLDPSFSALLLTRMIEVYDLTLGDEPDDSDGLPIIRTVDTFFAVKLLSDDGDMFATVHGIIDNLYRYDITIASHLLMTARSEPIAQLEEDSYRWKSGRLADLGYTEYYEALQVFQPIDIVSMSNEEATTTQVFGKHTSSDIASLPPEQRLFFHEVFETLDSKAQRLVLTQILWVTNRVLVAFRVSPGDGVASQQGMERTIATISLALDYLSSGDSSVAANKLVTIALLRLHRLGHTLTIRVGRIASLLKAKTTLCSISDQEKLGTIGALYPKMPLGGPLASRKDLASCAEIVTQVATKVALGGALGAAELVMGTRAKQYDYDAIIATALVNAMLGLGFAAVPILAKKVPEVQSQLLVADRLTDTHRQLARKSLVDFITNHNVEAPPQVVRRLLEDMLHHIESHLAPLQGNIDAKFASGLMIQQPSSPPN